MTKFRNCQTFRENQRRQK